MQAAAVIATVVYHAANRPDLLPRKELPPPLKYKNQDGLLGRKQPTHCPCASKNVSNQAVPNRLCPRDIPGVEISTEISQSRFRGAFSC
jgi:hypothetical protein